MNEWGFFIDENLEPQIATRLRKRGFVAETVRDALELGTDDPEVLDYARENDYILVTGDIEDFSAVEPDRHAGILLLDRKRASAYEVATAIADPVEEYPDRDSLRYRTPLDPYLD